MSMRWLRRFATLGFVAVACQATAAAQDGGKSLQDLVATALSQSPRVLAARARVEAARGERLQAGLRPNPGLVSDFREELGGSDRLAMVGLSWPLDLFRRPRRTEVADRGIEAAEHELANVERVLVGEVRSTAIRLAAAVRQLRVREQTAQTLAQFRDLVGARAASGVSPPLERDMADVDARRAAAEVLRQRAVADAVRAELQALVGLPQEEPILLRDSLEQLSIPTSQPGDRADLQFAEAERRVASANLALIRSEAKPDVTLNASYMRMSTGYPQFGLDAGGGRVPIAGVFHNVSFGAMVSLPLRDKRQGDIAAALARVTAADRNADAVRLTVSAEVAAARARVQRLDEALALYTDGLRELALKNVDVMRGSYELGRATLLDVLNETRRQLETEMAYTELLFESLQARSDLATALGVIR